MRANLDRPGSIYTSTLCRVDLQNVDSYSARTVAVVPPLTNEPSAAYLAANGLSPAAKAGPADAFRLAQKTWLEGRRIEMGQLAEQLGVSRPTIYNWCGSRGQLTIDVIWSVTEPLLLSIWSEEEGLEGAERMLATLERFLEVLAASEALQAFLTTETHAALRLLTTRGAFQDRLVAAVERGLSEEVEAGRLELRAAPELVAYALVRLIEGFLYNDAIVAIEPQIDEAIAVARLVLD